MHFYIRKKAVLQYILLYLLLVMNQTHVYRLFIDSNLAVQMVLVVAMGASLAIWQKKACIRPLFIGALLLLSVIFVRIMQGGIGIVFWSEMIIRILIVYVAILIDKENYWTRFVKIITFFAAISIIGWGQQVIGIDIMRRIAHPFKDVRPEIIWGDLGRVVRNRNVYGILFYTTSDLEFRRNVGIFTEPGIYQMVLNSCVFVLLYFHNCVKLSNKTIKCYLIICVIALILTQSTSGYFGLAVLFLGIVISRSKEAKSFKNTVLLICVIGVVVLLGDLAIRADSSLLYKAIISKIFTDSGTLDINASTGMYRIASIVVSLQAMVQHPLGLGVDKWFEFSTMNYLAGAGGWPFKLGAILGVIPFCVSMVWLFYPLKYLKRHPIEIVLLIFLYFNSSLAQTSAFYPTLITVFIYLSLEKCDMKKIEVSGKAPRAIIINRK